jgi:hypothetical protein
LRRLASLLLMPVKEPDSGSVHFRSKSQQIKSGVKHEAASPCAGADGIVRTCDHHCCYAESAGPERVVISLSDQMAYLYRGDSLMAAATISTGRDDKPTPSGIFSVYNKTLMHHSNKYDDAPMPFAQFFEHHGIAMHAGFNPGHPASHGCVRLPSGFAKKLYSVTDVGTPVYIGS